MILLLVILFLLTIILDDKFMKPKKIEFLNGAKTEIIKTYEDTVDSFLRAQNISLSRSDILINQLSEPIVNGMRISLIRVTEEIVCEEEKIQHEEIVKRSSSVPADSLLVVSEGADGVKKNYFKMIYHNGAQKSREFLGSSIAKQMTPRLTLCSDEKKGAAPGQAKKSVNFDVTVVKNAEKYITGDKIEKAAIKGFVSGVAFVKKGVLDENTLIQVEGYGTFVVKNESNEIPDQFVPASNTSLKLVLSKALASQAPQEKRTASITVI